VGPITRRSNTRPAHKKARALARLRPTSLILLSLLLSPIPDAAVAAAATNLFCRELQLHLRDVTLLDLALGEARRRGVGRVLALLRGGRVHQARQESHAQDAHDNLANLVLPEALQQPPTPRHKQDARLALARTAHGHAEGPTWRCSLPTLTYTTCCCVAPYVSCQHANTSL